MKRNKSIDIAKGIGLLLVIIGHLLPYGSILSSIIFSFHMLLFFFLSGYVTSYTNDKRYLIYKILNLLIPYFFFSLLSIVISMIIPYWRDFSFHILLKEYLYDTNPNSFHIGQIWFLISSIWVVILFYLSESIFTRTREKVIFAILCYFLVFLIRVLNIRICIAGNLVRMPLKIDNGLAGYIFFYIGYITRKYQLGDKILYGNFRNIIIFVVSTILVFLISQLNGMVNIDTTFGNPFLYLVGAFSGITSIISFSKLIEEIKVPIFSYLGKNSLVIFSMHSYPIILCLYVLNFIIKNEYRMMINVPYIYCIIITIFVVIFCIPFTFIYNKFINKYLSKMRDRIIEYGTYKEKTN